jgi:uncharacterized protein YbjQ (UPF0145 family)
MFGRAISRFINTASQRLARIINKAGSFGSGAFVNIRNNYSTSGVSSEDIMNLFTANRDMATQLARS